MSYRFINTKYNIPLFTVATALISLWVAQKTYAQASEPQGKKPVPSAEKDESVSTPMTTQEKKVPVSETQTTETTAEGSQTQAATDKTSEPDTDVAAIPSIPKAETQQPKECFPLCRSGYVCQQGNCISACNPPCMPSQTCTDRGECLDTEYTSNWPETLDEKDPGDAKAHLHRGFFLRLDFGIGYSSFNRKKGEEIEMKGGSTFFSFDLGWAVIEDTIVHARLSYSNNTNPVVVYDDRDYVDTERTHFDLLKVAPAASYYFMPINIYGTIALGMANLYLEIDDRRLYDRVETKGSDIGFFVEVDVGKEWWVDSDWGVGVIGRFSYINLPPEDSESSTDRIHTFTGGVLLSATYN